MAGSISYQTYVSDNGNSYAIKMDKSNALAVNASATATPASLPSEEIPQNITPRYAIYISDDGLTSRKVVVLTPADVGALQPNDNFATNPGGINVKLSYLRGESIRLPRLLDTGLTT